MHCVLYLVNWRTFLNNVLFLFNIILYVQTGLVRKINKKLRIRKKETILSLYQDYIIDCVKIPQESTNKYNY